MKRCLRRDSELCKNRNACANDGPDGVRKFRGAVQLDYIGARFFYETDGGPYGALHTFLKGTKWEIATDESSLGSPADRFTHNDHLVQGDLQRVLMTPEVNADRVSDRQNIDADTIRDLSDLEVPGNKTDDLLTVAFHLLQGR